MAARHKILLLDDDEQMLELYQEILKDLPAQPEVRTCTSGARAISLLESESFRLLITDLRMPKMDGLQVLAIVRRKFPDLRIIVLTGLVDEEFRSRAYAQGVELFWQKPSTAEEVQFFKDCVESLLDREDQADGGFRGMQRKSLVDLIQLECLSQSSSVLRITQGNLEGKIWVGSGNIVDAATLNLNGEAAFKEILSWKGGNFEILPGEPDHKRVIMGSYQGLLLDSAQALDENKGQMQVADIEAALSAGTPAAAAPSSPLAPLAKFEGVEFVVSMEKGGVNSYGAENPQAIAAFMQEAWKRLGQAGELMQAGGLSQMHCTGLQRHIGLAGGKEKGLLSIGFKRTMNSDAVEQTTKQIYAKWVS